MPAKLIQEPGLTWVEEDDGLESGVLGLVDPHLSERPDNLVHQSAPDLVHRNICPGREHNTLNMEQADL